MRSTSDGRDDTLAMWRTFPADVPSASPDAVYAVSNATNDWLDVMMASPEPVNGRGNARTTMTDPANGGGNAPTDQTAAPPV